PVLGIDPAANVAEAARARGVPTLARFFGTETAAELVADGRRADLVVGNNVLAQVPDLNDFVRGVEILLADDGLATFEFPHLLRLLEGNQFDTIYHEHFSYFSLGTALQVFAAHGLTVVDVEELSTHGGSLRLFLRHSARPGPHASPAVERVLEEERAAGLLDLGRYRRFGEQAAETKRRFMAFLIGVHDEGHQVAAYGAPGKGNTFLNYCGVRGDLIEYTVDRNPYKHGRYLPGTHIPIEPPDHITETKPTVIVILPWNLRAEIAAQLAYTRAWGARLVVAIPRLTVLE
ncbi:MAG TPA: class I SAM-dependent methyltransferase, partial [Candidatus Limnocylindrales bacterium]